MPRAGRFTHKEKRAMYTKYEWTALTRNMPTATEDDMDAFIKEKAKIDRAARRRYDQVNKAQMNTFANQLANVEAHRLGPNPDAAEVEAAETLRLLPPNRAAHLVDWPLVLTRCANLATAYESFKAPQRDLIRAQQQLVAIVGIVYADVGVHQYAQEQLDGARDRLQHFHDRRFEFEDLFEHPPLPPANNGGKKIKEADLIEGKFWKASEDEADRRKATSPAAADELIGQEWIAYKPDFLQGGHSSTSVWVRFDDNDTIADRLLKKEVYMKREDWCKATLWDRAIHDSNREIMEISCHSLYHTPRVLGSRGRDRVNVPRVRHSDFEDKLFRYRMYMDYCDHGNLEEFIKKYMPPARPVYLPGLVPEPFLWRVFDSLARIGVAMERGHVNINKDPLAGFRGVIHRDLKPRNVFLDEPDERCWSIYPTPRLGDFGAAVKTTQDDPTNPYIFHDGPRTLGFTPPEQLSYIDYETLEPVDDFKLGTKTNVWGIGMIMFALTRRNIEPRQPKWLGNDGNIAMEALQVRPGLGSRYSVRILDLISQCIEFDPAVRPTFAQILGTLQTAIATGLTENCENGSDNDIPIDDVNRLRATQDVYALGLARAEVGIRN